MRVVLEGNIPVGMMSPPIVTRNIPYGTTIDCVVVVDASLSLIAASEWTGKVVAVVVVVPCFKTGR